MSFASTPLPSPSLPWHRAQSVAPYSRFPSAMEAAFDSAEFWFQRPILVCSQGARSTKARTGSSIDFSSLSSPTCNLKTTTQPNSVRARKLQMKLIVFPLARTAESKTRMGIWFRSGRPFSVRAAVCSCQPFEPMVSHSNFESSPPSVWPNFPNRDKITAPLLRRRPMAMSSVCVRNGGNAMHV
jgi:hypothetical protein